ncbi:MAG: glutaredoxin family protein [Betaproteobacteria bacterium]|nr:MAG: glutaredoxin family protein [Betaproteobacteria bacterium]
MRVLIAFMLLACAVAAEAQLYRWTDSGGTVHYTDTPPPVGAKNVEKKESARPAGQAAAADGQQPYALQLAVKNFPVTIYTASDCGNPCKKGLEYLTKRGIPFAEKTVNTQAEIDAVTKLSGAPKVPVLVVGIVVKSEFEEQAWGEALDTAGYPKAGSR